MSKTDLDLHPWAVAYFIDEEPETRYWGELLAQGHVPIPGWGQETGFWIRAHDLGKEKWLRGWTVESDLHELILDTVLTWLCGVRQESSPQSV